MFATRTYNNTCFAKDAHSTAPSTKCAHTSAFTFNNAFITGIAAAVSVFLLFAIISIISYGIIIRDILMIMSFVIIIMSVIMYSIIIMCQQNNLNIKAKLR